MATQKIKTKHIGAVLKTKSHPVPIILEQTQKCVKLLNKLGMVHFLETEATETKKETDPQTKAENVSGAE